MPQGSSQASCTSPTVSGAWRSSFVIRARAASPLLIAASIAFGLESCLQPGTFRDRGLKRWVLRAVIWLSVVMRVPRSVFRFSVVFYRCSLAFSGRS